MLLRPVLLRLAIPVYTTVTDESGVHHLCLCKTCDTLNTLLSHQLILVQFTQLRGSPGTKALAKRAALSLKSLCAALLQVENSFHDVRADIFFDSSISLRFGCF